MDNVFNSYLFSVSPSLLLLGPPALFLLFAASLHLFDASLLFLLTPALLALLLPPHLTFSPLLLTENTGDKLDLKPVQGPPGDFCLVTADLEFILSTTGISGTRTDP